MSDGEGFVVPVNVVKPISHLPSDVQGLEDANHSVSINSICLPPNSPPALIAALQKVIESFDLFTEPFGTVNKYGETILFELPLKVCTVVRHSAQFTVVNSEIDGKVAIIFYSDESKVFMIVNSIQKFWPCATKELLSHTEFDVNVHALLPTGSVLYLYKDICNTANGYVFEVQPSVFIKFSNKEQLIQFKNVIRNVQSRISMKRLPTNDFSKKGTARVISEFWFKSALRPCSVKLLCTHEGPIWTKIEISKGAAPEHGIVALAQSKMDKTLQLIIISKNTKTNEPVSENFKLIPSDISPEQRYFVWEWFVDYKNRRACGFKSVKEASDFKIVIDYYVDALKKNSLSWDW